MNRLRCIALILFISTLFVSAQKDERFQYGLKFGIVQNSFEALPDSTLNPFATLEIDGRTGFMAEAFYDYQLAPKQMPPLYLTFGLGYKLLIMRGEFMTDDDPPLTGDFHNYFHTLDFPVGAKMIFKQFQGRPFVGAGLQMDAIIAESKSQGGTHGTPDDALPDFESIPDYRTRLNTGIYVNGGFEIPGGNYLYVFEFRYIHWSRDNFTADTSFYERSRGEIQWTFGVKIR
jgi:hypothetical protein